MDQVFSFKKKKNNVQKYLKIGQVLVRIILENILEKSGIFVSPKSGNCFNLTFCAFWKVDCNCVSIIQNYWTEFFCPPYYFYRPQRSWGKVIFSQACVTLFTGGSASVHAGIPPPWEQAHPHREQAYPPDQAPLEAWGKVMFSHACVILFTGGSASVHAGIPPRP